MDELVVEKIFSNLGFDVISSSRVKTLSDYVFRVETNNGNYFLKIFLKDSKKAFKLANLYSLLSKRGVLVPRVLKFDDSLSLIDYSYLILSEVEGDLLGVVKDSFSNNDLQNFYHSFGRAVASIHSITFDKFGECFDGGSVQAFSGIGPFSTWLDFYKEILNQRLSVLENSVLQDLIEPLKSWFDSNFYLIDFDVVPRLLHEDLHQKNVFIKNSVVSGIIDFDGAFIGHSEEELMRLECANFSGDSSLKEYFFKGYKELVELDEGYDDRRIFYYLSRLLVHIRCVLEFGDDYVGDVSKEISIMRSEINSIIAGEGINFDKNKVNT